MPFMTLWWMLSMATAERLARQAGRGTGAPTAPSPADIIESARLERADRVAHAAWLSHVYQCGPEGPDCYRAEQECADGRRLRSSSDTALERYRAHQASVGLSETPS